MQKNNCSTMVRLECANFNHGLCLFAGECPVLSGRRCTVSRETLLGGSPDAGGIDYFSACVIPLAKRHPEYAEAAVEYARICGTSIPATRHCDCGKVLAKGKRCCSSCRSNRAQQSTRKYRALMSEKFSI